MKIDTSYGIIELPVLTAKQTRKLIEFAVKTMAADTVAVARHKHRQMSGTTDRLATAPDFHWQSNVLAKITVL